MRKAHFDPSRFKGFRLPAAAVVPFWLLAGAATHSSAQNSQNAGAGETREWAQGAIDHVQQMPYCNAIAVRLRGKPLR